MPARSVCLVALSLSEAGPGRFGRQVSIIDIHHTIPYQNPKGGKLSLQSGTCQAGVNSCQVGLLSAPLPPARAAEGSPCTHLLAASKSHVWKRMSADRDVCSAHRHSSSWGHLKVSNLGIGCAVPTT